MAYSVYSFGSQYTDTGLVGIYVGTREENLASCLEIVAEQIADIAAGNLRDRELQRAKENLKGRIVLSMESTSNRMSRLGRSLITDTELLSLDRIIAEIDAVDPTALAELAGVLLDPARLSAAGIGPGEERFLEGGRARPPGAGGCGVKVDRLRLRGEGRRGDGRRARRGRPRGARRRDRRRDAGRRRRGGRLHAARRGGREHRALSRARGAGRRRHDRLGGRARRGSTPPRGSGASPSSSRRTSRSAPC